MIRLLLDQGLPRSTTACLGNFGISAEHVGNLGLATATDEAIILEARARDAIVVSSDADFHALLAKTNAATPSVIRIRCQGLKAESIARIIERTVKAVEQELLSGAAVTVSERRLAMRRLPLHAKRA